MKHILTITDKEITGSDKLSTAQPRIAVNAILFDADENIALCYMGKYDLHTLPGGGVEVGEDLQSATQREIWEETGCQCEIIGELGKIIENRYEHDFSQERSYYIARVTGEKGELHLTNEEIAENTSVVWLPIEQALQIISEKEHDNYQRKFIQKRDIAALTEALLWLRLHDIPGYDTFTKIEPLNKGWSPDKKYYIETKDARKLLLRVADTDELDRKKAEYNALGKTAELDVYTPRPCGFGLCNGGANVYYLVTWLEGEDAASVMASMTDEQRYALGIKSGELLRKLHTLPAPINAEPWDIRFQRKIDERLSQYHENKGQTENGELAIRYLNNNAQLLKNRRQAFTHGDFNTTNLIVSPNGEVGVIDFNCFNDNCDYGDPMFEMIAISYMETPDPYYYTGLWNGYASGQPDTEFFAITAYYFAYDILSSLGGNESFDNGGFDKNALSWYDNFNRVVPSWYLKDFYVQWIDGIPYKLKAPFDFSFISKYGKVFKVFDNQGSGNICFGMAEDENKYFVKFAGAPTGNYTGTAEDAIERLKRAVPTYQDLAHPNVINLIKAEEIGGGYAAIFDWVDATHMWTPDGGQEFKNLPVEKHYKIFENILDFHKHMAEKGYSALDFYEDHIMWDLKNGRAVICDIDFYSKGWYEGMSGIWNTDCEWYSPEQFIDGAAIDEISCVYVMGITAFALFGDSRDRCFEKWKLSRAIFDVAKKAVNEERSERQQSIAQFIAEWRAAR